MSAINSPMHREPVEIDGRAMTPARRARIIARDKHCRYPGCAVEHPLEIDHIVALELGGKDEDWNLQALCVEHHKIKTRADRVAIAKVKRLNLTHRGLKPESKAKLRGRKFQSTRDWPESDA